MLNLPVASSELILCHYVNFTNQIQVARISNISGWFFERVIFPGQRLLFEAPCQGEMKIYTGMMATALLSERIFCESLQIHASNHATPSSALNISMPSEPEPNRELAVF